MSDIVVQVVDKDPIVVTIVEWWSWWWWWGTIIINNNSFLWYYDAVNNTFTKDGVVTIDAIQAWIAPFPTDWYAIVEVWWLVNVDNITTVTKGQVVFFRNSLRDAEANLEAHLTDFANPHQTSFTNILWSARDSADLDIELTALDNDISTINTTLTNKADLIWWLVPASQLPSFVDDVLEFPTLWDFPAIWEMWKIYLALDTNLTYRRSWSVYVQLSEAEWGSITGTLSNQTDLQTALDAKLPIQAWSNNTTTVTFVIDKTHGTYAAPLAWNIIADTTWAVNWVTNDMFHNDTTEPTYTGVTSVNGTYTPGSVNMLSFQYKWGAVVLFIQTLA